MRKLENFHLLVMLILLVAVGQMAQTIYVPVIADIAHDLSVRTGAATVMAAYLLTYGFSQLIYGPISDRIGRRPVILTGMMIFLVGALARCCHQPDDAGRRQRDSGHGHRRGGRDGAHQPRIGMPAPRCATPTAC